MFKIDKFIFKEGSKFYMDLEECNESSDVQYELGDIIKFSYEKKKYTAKIVDSKNGVAEVSIQKENDL